MNETKIWKRFGKSKYESTQPPYIVLNIKETNITYGDIFHSVNSTRIHTCSRIPHVSTSIRADTCHSDTGYQHYTCNMCHDTAYTCVRKMGKTPSYMCVHSGRPVHITVCLYILYSCLETKANIQRILVYSQLE